MTFYLCPPSDQSRPAHLLAERLPVAGLPVLPPQKPDEGKGGPGQTGSWTGDGGPQPQWGQWLQASQQWPECCGGLDQHNGTEGHCKIFVLMCLFLVLCTFYSEQIDSVRLKVPCDLRTIKHLFFSLFILVLV